MSLRLSKSQLDKFVACPRCFWLAQRHKLAQPDMISSKVWKGVERVTIQHYEEHRRAKTTPTNLVGFVPDDAIPYQGDRLDLKSLRYWGKGLSFAVDGVQMTTALDDMLQYLDGNSPASTRYAVIDYKSKSKPTDEEATRDLYQNQADVFDLACNVNGYPTDGLVYFDYWYPRRVMNAEQANEEHDGHGLTTQKWGSQVVVLKADHARIKKLILAAAACLEGPMPDPVFTTITPKGKPSRTEPSCPVCAYVHERELLFASMKAATVPA